MQAANFSLPKNSGYLILGLLLVFYLVNGINYLKHQSVTSDEASFMGYAIRYLKGEPERVYPRTGNSKMPVIVLNMLPRIAEEKLGGPKEKTDWGLSDTMNGRYMTLLLSIFTILLVYGWSRQLYGEAAGLFSTFLMVCCPNNLANAALVTTDSYSVLFLLLCMYLLWQFCKTRRSLDFILLAIAVAMAQLVKQSLFHLYILVPLCLLIHGLVYKEKFKVGLFIKRLLLFIGCSVLIINIGYYFNGSFTRLSEYNFMSNLFMGVQNVFPGSLPLPLPKPFVDGLDMAKYYDQLGGGIDNVSSFGKVTILGQSRTGDGFWYYYLVSFFPGNLFY